MYLATEGMLDGKPDYVRGLVAAGLTYGFSRHIMGVKRNQSAAWGVLALILELL